MSEIKNDIALEELETLAAIYPEAIIIRDPPQVAIEIPAPLKTPLIIKLKNISTDKILREAIIHHLSPLNIKFILPKNYPETEPPIISIECSWIKETNKKRIICELQDLWESYHDMIIFTLIDHLQTEMELNTFNEFVSNEPLVLTTTEKFEKFIENDNKAQIKIFKSQTFFCEICQEERKGDLMTKFDDCSHTYCNSCLSDYFTDAIKRGEVENIHCPNFECTKKIVNSWGNMTKDLNSLTEVRLLETRVFQSPVDIEVLSKILDPEILNRFMLLFRRQQFDKISKLFPNRTVECPRSSCQNQFLKKQDDDMLVICPSCKFAFCYKCKHSWHGYQNICSSVATESLPNDILEDWINSEPGSATRIKLGFAYGKRFMQLAANEYIAQKLFEEAINSSDSEMNRCPSCSLVIERLSGCNKMTCSRCRSFFCNICGLLLNPKEPYFHFNDPESSCFGKLFVGLIDGE